MSFLARAVTSRIFTSEAPLLGRWCRPDTHPLTCNVDKKLDLANLDNSFAFAAPPTAPPAAPPAVNLDNTACLLTELIRDDLRKEKSLFP